jgi:hypothetical protein
VPVPLMDNWLRGDWMQMWTGGKFYPEDPRAEDVHPADIAHALSFLCRYAGHVERFYSVAEHCALMSDAVSPQHALAALLHDATEAYVVDVPHPVKVLLPDYRALEYRVWMAIVERFGLDTELPPEVHEADKRILLTERNALLPRTVLPWDQDAHYVPLPVAIEGWSPAEAERQYTERLVALTKEG